MAEDESATQDKINPFDAVRDQIKFKGFTGAQRDEILDQYEEAYNAPGGTKAREMIDAGLALPDGLTVYNSNSQGVIVDYSEAAIADAVADYELANPGIKVSQADIDKLELDTFNESLSGDFSPSTAQGHVFISAYPSIPDQSTGIVETYNYPGAVRDGQSAVASPPFRSVDHNGVMFDVPPIQTLIHETNHAVTGDIDLAPDGTTLETNLANGQYYTIDTTGNAADDYRGPNETATQEMLKEMGYTQLRGAYVGNWNTTNNVGDDYGLGRQHDVGITSGDIDMTTHAPVNAVVIGVAGQANTFKLGDGNDTVHAFDGTDTVHTGAGDDHVFLGLGDDTAHAGWGANTIDGGDANLDPKSDHRSDNVTDWGFDTVNYTTLPAGFASPDALQADAVFDGTARDGVLITISGDDVSVNKGQENSVRLGEDVDQLHNIDAITGSTRDDLTEVNALSGDRAIDGAGGTDTLRIDGLAEGVEVTNTVGPVTFNGVTYDGVISDGTNNLYYTDYENIIVEQPEVAGAVMDANDFPPVIPPVDASLDGAPTGSRTISLEDAIGMLAADQKALNASNTGEQASHIQDALNHSDAAQMFQNLHTHGVKTLTADITSDMSAEDRAREILVAGQEATQEAGISMPSEQRDIEVTQALNNSYEDDYSHGL